MAKGESYKLNQNYARWYAKKIEQENPGLRGMFRFREDQ
jgi:hypothetical protein